MCKINSIQKHHTYHRLHHINRESMKTMHEHYYIGNNSYEEHLDFTRTAYVSELKNIVTVGTFIQLSNVIETRLKEAICYRILDIVPCTSDISHYERPTQHGVGPYFKLQLFLELNNPEATRFNVLSSTLERIVEVYDSRCYIWLPVSNIISNICFVFREQHVRDKLFNCIGIKFCFIVRYKAIDSSTLNLLQDFECLPFPCDYISHRNYWSSSLARNIWNSIDEFLLNLSQVLMRSTQIQGLRCRQSKQFAVHDLFIHLLTTKTFYYSGEATKYQFHYTVSEGYDFNKRRRNCAYQVFRYETKQQLVSLREVAGAYATHGLRDDKPRMNETKTLCSGSTINIVIGTDEAAILPFSFHTDRRGIDICFNRIDKRILLLVRYESVTLTGNNVNAINDEYLSDIVTRVQTNHTTDISTYCFIGATFDYADESDLGNEHVYEINAIHDNYILAVNTDTGLQKKFCGKEIVADLVRQKLE